MYLFVMLFHIVGPWCCRSRVAWTVFAGSSLHSSSVWRTDFGAFPHLHGDSGHIRLVSTVVSEAHILAIALAERLLRLVVGPKGFRLRFVLSWCRVCHASAQLWYGRARSHVRVVWLHGHGLSLAPSFAGMSAFWFPFIPIWDVVYFPLILKPSCHKIFTSSSHALTYSLPALGPPVKALSAF